MSQADAESLIGIADKSFSTKLPYDQLCQDIAENFYPVRGTFTVKQALGSDFAGTIMDSHTINVREELGNSIAAMLRNGRDWFAVGTGDEDRDKEPIAARALARATRQMAAIINDPRSNFSTATKEADHDWVSFGNPVLSVEENNARDFLRVRAWHPSMCAWHENADGDIDTNFRRFPLQARAVKALVKSGRWSGTLHADIEMACNKEPFKEFLFTHVLMPSDELYGWDGKKMREVGQPWISVYLDVEHKIWMQERGEPMFSYVIPRYRRLSGYPYGFSPTALNSLPDARMLQDMSRVILEQGEKAVDPPMLGAQELFTRDLNMFSGGFTAVDLPEERSIQDVFTTIDTTKGVALGVDLKQDIRAMITEAWLLNRLYLPSVREMRELEVAVRTEEFRRAALPFFAPIQDEYNSPLLTAIMERALLMRIIPPEQFPAALQDRDVRFTFNSPLNEAEGKKKVEAFNSMMQTAASAAQLDQTVPNLVNWRQAANDAFIGAGAEPEWLFSEGEARKSKDQEAELANNMRQAAEIANSGASTVANVSNAAMAAQQAGIA